MGREIFTRGDLFAPVSFPFSVIKVPLWLTTNKENYTAANFYLRSKKQHRYRSSGTVCKSFSLFSPSWLKGAAATTKTWGKSLLTVTRTWTKEREGEGVYQIFLFSLLFLFLVEKERFGGSVFDTRRLTIVLGVTTYSIDGTISFFCFLSRKAFRHGGSGGFLDLDFRPEV